MAPFYGWGSTGSRLEGTSWRQFTFHHFMDLRKLKSEIYFGAAQWF